MLTEFITPETVIINPDFSTKEELFDFISADAEEKGLVSSAARFKEALMEREKQISTEIEKGIAVPHARNECVKNLFIYVIVSIDGIKFSGFGSKIKIAFLTGAPPKEQHYLDTMAMTARLLQKKDFREELLSSTSPDTLYGFIKKASQATATVEKGLTGRHCIVMILNNNTVSMDTGMELAIELGVKGAQVIDTTNVVAKTALNFPFFSLFSAKDDRTASKALIGIVEDPQIAGRLCAHLKQEDIDIFEPGAGTIFTFPVGMVYGGADEDVF